MRRFLSFDYDGATLQATLDDGDGRTGLLIVSGGNEIRIGAHRGMARLASDIAGKGYPVFRFDRRGVGDSDGTNAGFESSGPDLRAAIAAFRAACPDMTRMIAFGNCDAASALLLHAPEGIDALVLSNIWVVEPTDDLPPPAAIKSHYRQRLRDPKAWRSLLSGDVNIGKLLSGLRRLAAPAVPSALSDRIARAMADGQVEATILLASRDGTARSFAEAWATRPFDAARASGRYRVVEFDSNAHSFARAADYAVMRSAILERLSGG